MPPAISPSLSAVVQREPLHRRLVPPALGPRTPASSLLLLALPGTLGRGLTEVNTFGRVEMGIILRRNEQFGGDPRCLTVQSRFPVVGDLEPGLVLRGCRRPLSPWRGAIRAATTALAGLLRAPLVPLDVAPVTGACVLSLLPGFPPSRPSWEEEQLCLLLL